MKKLTSFVLIMFLAIITVSTLTSCGVNPNTCVHSWGAPTCLEPAQCYKCDTYKAGGELGNHNYQPATCREPAKCIYCYQYKDDTLGAHKFSEETDRCIYCGISEDPCAKGHTKGDWIVTQKATLVSKGAEEMLCSVCGEVIDSRTVSKKSPQVDDDYFNFTDAELIEWLNDISTVDVYNTDLGIFDEDSTNTSYKIVYDGETGALLLNHGDNGKNGNIQAIMVYFDDIITADAIAIFLGGKIDSNFDTDDAIYDIGSGKSSYSAAGMTILELELDDDFIVALLAPTEYLEDL